MIIEEMDLNVILPVLLQLLADKLVPLSHELGSVLFQYHHLQFSVLLYSLLKAVINHKHNQTQVLK